MNILNAEILSNKMIAKNIFEMKIKGNFTSYIRYPGEFIGIEIKNNPQFLLKRPISISDYDNTSLTIVYKILGDGTKELSLLKPLDTINIMISLGSGFKEIKKNSKCLIIGGGVGIPPLLNLIKVLKKNDCTITSVLGFKKSEDIFYEKAFKEFSKTFICTDDKSYGYGGNTLSCIKDNSLYDFDCIYACGPNKMLKEIQNIFKHKELYLSIEKRMACLIGACYACVCNTVSGQKLVCTDGPVFKGNEVIFDE